jgi:hypothetical protein
VAESVGEVAHLAQVEVDFLLSSTLMRFLSTEQAQGIKTSLAVLKKLAAEGLDDDEESDAVLEYSLNHLGQATRMYVASLAA